MRLNRGLLITIFYFGTTYATLTERLSSISGAVAGIIFSTASELNNDNNSAHCGKISNAVDDFRYEYLSPAGDCTRGEHEIVVGAVNHYIRTMYNDLIRGTVCLRMDLGGNYNGFLKAGKQDDFDLGLYCGPKLAYMYCASGCEECSSEEAASS